MGMHARVRVSASGGGLSVSSYCVTWGTFHRASMSLGAYFARKRSSTTACTSLGSAPRPAGLRLAATRAASASASAFFFGSFDHTRLYCANTEGAPPAMKTPHATLLAASRFSRSSSVSVGSSLASSEVGTGSEGSPLGNIPRVETACVEWLTARREGASAARAGAVARGEEEGSEMARGTSATCVQVSTASMATRTARVATLDTRTPRQFGSYRASSIETHSVGGLTRYAKPENNS
eukprot:scaffold116512_cov87-Phaeocystis_antarctica.AAC.5